SAACATALGRSHRTAYRDDDGRRASASRVDVEQYHRTRRLRLRGDRRNDDGRAGNMARAPDCGYLSSHSTPGARQSTHYSMDGGNGGGRAAIANRARRRPVLSRLSTVPKTDRPARWRG